MSQLPLDRAIDRFQGNEERVDAFVNQTGTYSTRYGTPVETLPSFIERKDAEIDARYPDGYVNRGAFASDVLYSVNDIVTYGGYAYLNVAEYTSGATTPDADRAHWVLHQGVTDAELDAALLGRDFPRSQAAYAISQMFDLTPRPHMRPSVEFLDAVMSGTVKVVIVGDSISAGADLYYPNSYAQNLTQMLKQQFPWITWNVVNYAIGGRGIANIASASYVAPDDFYFPANNGSQNVNCQYWPDGSVAGKSWRDHVKDEAPDLIVFAFGMNDGTDVDAFRTNFNAFYAYTQTWTKKPWFTLNSCFLPTKEVVHGNPLWQSWQKHQQEIADWVRHKAIYAGFGLIDANAIYRLLRDGVRREYAPFVHELSWRYWGDSSKWSSINAAPAVAGGRGSWTSAGFAVRRVEARDVDISLDFRIDSVDAVARINYRCITETTDLAGYAIQYYGGGGSGFIDIYYKTTLLLTVDAGTVPVGSALNLRVKATGNLHEVWFNGDLKAAITHYDGGLYAGPIEFGCAQGQLAVTNVLLTYAPEPAVAPAYFNEAYLIGAVPYGDIMTNPDSGGGNAINHPSTLGSYAFYVPAVARWLREFGDVVFNRPVTVSAGRQNAGVSAAELPALSALTEHECKVTVPTNRWAIAHVAFGYKNVGPSPGVLQLMIDGANYDAWWLPCTTMTSGTGATDPNPRNFQASVPVLLGPGTHTFGLRWGGAAGQAAMTSSGASRTLAVQVMPS